MRLDKYLVEQGYFESRNRALDAIKRGKVFVDGRVAKASQKCTEESQIDIDKEKFYVSRAAKKLEMFLEEHPIAVEGRDALDIGSSTGGFVQILLEKGAELVSCVDVGSNQLHHTLREDKRVKIYEETDIRAFEVEGRFELVTCDVSFISILQIVEAIDRLSSHDMILLFKPQFEVGLGVKRDSRGVVVNQEAIEESKRRFEERASELGWRLSYVTTSKLAGKSGNIEYVYHFKK